MVLILLLTALILFGFAIYSIREYFDASKNSQSIKLKREHVEGNYNAFHTERFVDPPIYQPSIKSLEKKIDAIGKRLLTIEQKTVVDSDSIKSISTLIQNLNSQQLENSPSEFNAHKYIPESASIASSGPFISKNRDKIVDLFSKNRSRPIERIYENTEYFGMKH